MDIDTRENKKLRLGEYEFQFEDERHEKVTSPFTEYDDYDEDGIEDKDDKDYIKFMKEYNANLGFDIKTFVPKRLTDMVAVLRVDINESNPLYRDCEKAVRSVLQYLDEQKEQSLELVEIIRATYRGNYVFFATFRARDKKTHVIQTYQSMVFRHFADFETILYIFKKEGDPIDKEEEVAHEFSDKRKGYEFQKITRYIYRGTREFDEKRKIYIQEHNESEGFDIQHFISPATLTPVSRADKYVFNHCTYAVNIVLDYLKKPPDELNLELLRLIKANYRRSNLYFVTFEAKNENSGEIKVYQSVIYHRRDDTLTALYMFREREEGKGKGKVLPAVEDVRNEYEFGKANGIDIATIKKLCEHDDSKGFHIFTEPERGVTGTELFQDCEIALKDVLEYLSLKVVKLVKITTVKYEEQQEEGYDDDEINYTFYITFEAKNKDSELETYESVISLYIGAPTRLHMLRKEK